MCMPLAVIFINIIIGCFANLCNYYGSSSSCLVVRCCHSDMTCMVVRVLNTSYGYIVLFVGWVV